MSDASATIAAVSPAAAGRGGVAGVASRRRSVSFGGWWGGVGLLILCLSVYLPGLWAIPPVDRDESRFAQASRQMYESGDWIIPRVQNKPRLNKPPLIYWCQCASVAVFGDAPGQYANGNIWVFRVPSVLAAIGAVLLTWRLGLRMFDPRAAWLGAAMLAVCPMVVWDAHQARADQLLLFCTIATQFALYVIWSYSPSQREGVGGRANDDQASATSARSARSPSSSTRRHSGLLVPLLFWLALGAGIMTKGPITPMIAVLTVLALCVTTRRWRWMLELRPLLGLVIIAAAVAPWLIALTHRLGHPTSEFRDELERNGFALARGESGWLIYLRIVYDETLGRSTGAKEGHWGPPGYHLVLLTVLFWPGSLLTGLAIAKAFRRAFPVAQVSAGATGGLSASASAHGSRFQQFLARLRSINFDPTSRFLLCWIIPSWLVFELLSTKLPHYTMPLYPAIALISARAVFAANRGVLKGLRDLGTRIGFAIWWIVGVAATLGLSVLVIVAGREDQSSSAVAAVLPHMLPGVVLAITLVAAGRSVVRGCFLRAQILSLLAVVMSGATFLQFALPGAGRFWVSAQISNAADSRWHGDGPLINLSEFHEDSLVFLTRARLTSALPDVPPREGRLVVVSPTDEPIPVLDGERLRLIRTVRGWNYSNGRRVAVYVSELDRTLHFPQ